MIGVLGEYLWRILDEARGRPLYIVERTLGAHASDVVRQCRQRCGFLTFIIGGAPRSGTTWLYELLDRHPDVYMAKPVTPEPKFFLVDRPVREGARAYYAETWFAGAGAGAAWRAKRAPTISRARPRPSGSRAICRGVKLMFILREPVGRAYSNYLWTKMNGLETEDFATALALEDAARARAAGALEVRAAVLVFLARAVRRPARAVSRSLSARTAAGPAVRRHRRARPAASPSALHRFLGVSPRPGDADGLGVVNPSEKDAARRSTRAFAASCAARYAEPNRRLARAARPGFRDVAGMTPDRARRRPGRVGRRPRTRAAWAEGMRVSLPATLLERIGWMARARADRRPRDRRRAVVADHGRRCRALARTLRLYRSAARSAHACRSAISSCPAGRARVVASAIGRWNRRTRRSLGGVSRLAAST